MSGIPPIIVDASGRVPRAPADINAELIADVAATNPGYTANLPGSLIEDISSTDTGAVVLIDNAVTETIDSFNPFGANAFMLNQLGTLYGIISGVGSNTSVNVVFTGPQGYVVAQGFVVSDGTYQYQLLDGGIIGAGGTTQPLTAVATQPGTWSVLASSVTQLVTSVPSSISLSVTNPLAGTPGGIAESEWDYRTRTLQAGLASSTGMARYTKTLLMNVPGVQQRLVSLQQQQSGGWKVIVGGGDPFAVAYAIWNGVFDVSTLVGSTISVTAITKANPGQVTTNLNHGLSTGAAVTITGVVGMIQVNNTPFTITVVDAKNFTIGVNTSSFTTYVAGGVISPNNRNITVPIADYPDVFTVPIVVPPLQTVTIAVTWNTSLSNFTAATAVPTLVSQPLINYINSIAVGQPIIVYLLEQTFSAAVSTVLPPQFLTKMSFAVSINSVGASPVVGTGEILSDIESYFFASPTAITVTQG